MSTTAPVMIDEPVDEDLHETANPWVVIVWNDPINTMDYVTFVLRKLFGYSEAKANKLMLQVHNNGRSAVAHGPREKMEQAVFRLHEHGLWATLEQD